MLKTVFGSIAAVLLFALAACDGGSAPPQSEGAADQTGSISTTPDPAAPAEAGTDTAQ